MSTGYSSECEEVHNLPAHLPGHALQSGCTAAVELPVLLQLQFCLETQWVSRQDRNKVWQVGVALQLDLRKTTLHTLACRFCKPSPSGSFPNRAGAPAAHFHLPAHTPAQPPGVGPGLRLGVWLRRDVLVL